MKASLVHEIRLALIVACLLPAAAVAAKPPVILPGLQLDGSVLLPNQWSLRPAGRQLVVGDFPINIALHPNGRYAAVLHSGYSQHEIRIVDLKSGQPVSQVSLDETFYGLAWSADGTQLFCSGASAEVVHAFTFVDGFLSAHRELRLRPETELGIPLGLAASPDGKALYVAEGWGQRIDKIDTTSGRFFWTRVLAETPARANSTPEGERRKISDDSDAPFPYTCLPDPRRKCVYVSLWAKSAILVLDAKSGAERARWAVGQHPNELALSADGRLFVAEANFNTVSVLDVENGRVLETLSTASSPDSPPGSTPNSLALSADGKLLFVANANNNNIAVFDVAAPRHASSLGFIPVGWFPTSVRITRDGRTLVVANGKGIISAANPAGTFPGDQRPRNLQEYIGALFKGTISLIDLPAPEQRSTRFGEWTQQALANTPVASNVRPARARPEGSPIPAAPGDASPIKHVIYIVKENRTYDQVFGDIAEGNGDAHLCLFPERITPNQHALAREFVLLDNFYADGEVSADGHEWSMGAYASDFVEKTWPMNYGHNGRHKFDYPGEGAFAIATPARGYLWDQAAKAGVTYRSYGEFIHHGSTAAAPAVANSPGLENHIDPLYRGFDLDYPDVKRAERFIAELKRYETEGELPQLQIVRLPNDHTSGTVAGKLTPTALVADNDLALGQLVEAVSHSKFWPTTAIFVLEDDAQNGPDHVDAHRIPTLVISPYTKRRALDSTLYSTTSMLRTIELILGLEPMSQFDAAAAPMFAAFTATPDVEPYAARPALVPLGERNAAKAYGADQSARMDFREADRADDIALNEIVWRSVKGAHSPMPAPVRAAFFRAHPKINDGDDDD